MSLRMRTRHAIGEGRCQFNLMAHNEMIISAMSIYRYVLLVSMYIRYTFFGKFQHFKRILWFLAKQLIKGFEPQKRSP